MDPDLDLHRKQVHPILNCFNCFHHLDRRLKNSLGTVHVLLIFVNNYPTPPHVYITHNKIVVFQACSCHVRFADCFNLEYIIGSADLIEGAVEAIQKGNDLLLLLLDDFIELRNVAEEDAHFSLIFRD
jgi:hypothetical protein